LQSPPSLWKTRDVGADGNGIGTATVKIAKLKVKKH